MYYINLNGILCYCKECKNLFDLNCVYNLINNEIKKDRDNKNKEYIKIRIKIKCTHCGKKELKEIILEKIKNVYIAYEN